MKACVWIILSILFCNCSNSDPQVKNSVDKLIKFNGITARDLVGAPIGNADPDDWNFNDKWIENELSLFGTSLSEDCPLPESYRIMAYPNPASSQVEVYIDKPDSARIAIRVVDRNFKVLMAADSLYAKSARFDFSKFEVQDTVRVYYKIINKSCEFRGHGDIFIRK